MKSPNSGQQFHTVLVLGGAGLVGVQVCRQIAESFRPKRVVVASLWLEEAEQAVRSLAREHTQTDFVADSGNLFVPEAICHEKPWLLGESREARAQVLDATYGPFDAAYRDNHLVRQIQRHRPEVIIDCVNTATGISYQNVTDGTLKVRDRVSICDLCSHEGVQDLETLLMSQSNPQLVRHVLFLYHATRDVGTRFYVKVGTTGTGGMGLNIPYTHGEDKPSPTLMAKTAVGFAHTGLLFLMARTPDAPIVKEIKPAAMIGYRAVRYATVHHKGSAFQVYEPKTESLVPGEARLETRQPAAGYDHVRELRTTVVDTGENGVFTRGEFAAITAMGQMEAVTPEEVAREVVLELGGVNSGKDVLSALDGAVVGPTYRAGLLRQVALADLAEIEQKMGDHSVALGILGPPELSKLLFEVYLLRQTFGGSKAEILRQHDEDGEAGRARRPEELAASVVDWLETDEGREVVRMSASVGLPILLPDGRTLLRGPRLNIPQPEGNLTAFPVSDSVRIDAWARKGWIDLRAENMKRWLDRFGKMARARQQVFAEGTAAVDIKTYIGGDEFEIGNAVAWIFNNELEGYRIK